MMAQSKRADALVIAAHHDDIEFGCAGSVARWVAEGERVVYCIVTDGAAGSNSPEQTRTQLLATRRAEQIAAADVVGVRDVIFLNEPDGHLEATLALRRDLTRVIRQWRPRRVVLPDPSAVLVHWDDDGDGPGWDYINHPDHRATGEAGLYAVFPSAETRPIFPELLAEGLEPHHVDEVYLVTWRQENHAVDIAPYLEQKIAALLCHRSQLGPQIGQRMREGAARLGEKYGLAAAETFRVLRFYRGEQPPGEQPPGEQPPEE